MPTSSLHHPRLFSLLGAIVLLSSISALPQQAESTPQTVEEALHQMSDSAGIIFSGEVIAMRTRTGENGSSGIVEIDFRIDQAVRGCTSGAVYTLREWAGLWTGGDQRYHLGQRLLMLLHAPGPSGITSPVGGMTGAIPIRATSSSPQLASSTRASTPLIADLRWVGTRLLRSTPYVSSPLVTAASTTASQPTPANSSVAAQQAPVSVVLDMLTSWQQATQP